MPIPKRVPLILVHNEFVAEPIEPLLMRSRPSVLDIPLPLPFFARELLRECGGESATRECAQVAGYILTIEFYRLMDRFRCDRYKTELESVPNQEDVSFDRIAEQFASIGRCFDAMHIVESDCG